MFIEKVIYFSHQKHWPLVFHKKVTIKLRKSFKVFDYFLLINSKNLNLIGLDIKYN